MLPAPPCALWYNIIYEFSCSTRVYRAGMRGKKEGVDLRLRERTVVHVAVADAQTRAADGHRTPPLFATRSLSRRVEPTDAQDTKMLGRKIADRIDSIGFGARALLASLENALRRARTHTPVGATWCADWKYWKLHTRDLPSPITFASCPIVEKNNDFCFSRNFNEGLFL